MSGFWALTVADVLVLIAAALGVGGSFQLYRRRRADEADRLRHALCAEVATTGDEIYETAAQMKGAELTDQPYLPEESPVVMTAYENNAGELGRLTAPEIDVLTTFYTAAALVDDRLRRAFENHDPSAVESLYLRAKLVELNNLNNAALDALAAEIDDPPVDVEHRRNLGGSGGVTLETVRDRLDDDP